MRKCFTVYRTWDYYETAFLLKTLVDKMASWGSIGQPLSSGLEISKRKRDGDEPRKRKKAEEAPKGAKQKFQQILSQTSEEFFSSFDGMEKQVGIIFSRQ